jgi:hypothetical protein
VLLEPPSKIKISLQDVDGHVNTGVLGGDAAELLAQARAQSEDIEAAVVARVVQPLLDGREYSINKVMRMAWRQSTPEHPVKDAELDQHPVERVVVLASVLAAAVHGVDVLSRGRCHPVQLHHVADALE